MKKWNWKKVMSAVAIALIVSLVYGVMCATAGEYVITGYGSGETAVKGDIEKQAKIMIESWGDKKPAKIIIKGFADTTGKTAENDAIARDRAREMEAFIKENINAEKITARSKGDSENVRKVVVVVEFYTTTVAEDSSYNLFSKIWPAAFGVAFIVWLILGIKFSPRRKEGKKLAKKPNTPTKKVNFNFDGVAYVCHPEIATDGRLKTFHKLGTDKYLYVSSDEEWKRSVRSTLKKDPDLMKNLLAEKFFEPA